MPEVSLVAILDADKEGFLRSETSLIQTIGRAARNAHGKVIMYADRITDSMQKAIDETLRRREVQDKYNQEHHITPKTIQKKIKNLIETTMVAEEKASYDAEKPKKKLKMTVKEKKKLILSLTKEMQEASRNLEFERAAQIRDIIFELNEKNNLFIKKHYSMKTIVLLLIHHKDDNVHICYLSFSFQVIFVYKFL